MPLFGGIADRPWARKVRGARTLRFAMTDATRTIAPCNCLGRTCMKWGADGELTALDLHLVLERLARVDQEVAALNPHTSRALP